MPSNYRWVRNSIPVTTKRRLNTTPNLFLQWLYRYQQKHLLLPIGTTPSGDDLCLSALKSHDLRLEDWELPQVPSALPTPLEVFMEVYTPEWDVELRSEGHVGWMLASTKWGLRPIPFIMSPDFIHSLEQSPELIEASDLPLQNGMKLNLMEEQDVKQTVELQPKLIHRNALSFTIEQLALERIELTAGYASDVQIPQLRMCARQILEAIEDVWPEAKSLLKVSTASAETTDGFEGKPTGGPKKRATQQDYRIKFGRYQQLKAKGKSNPQIARELNVS